jgi:VWFA-related protein
VISFDSGVDLLQDFTDNAGVLTDAVGKIRAGGGTALYDALYLAITEKLANEDGRRVLILISDGDDNSSRVSMTETLEMAQKHDVAIYAISTNTSAYFGSSQQARGDKTLKTFAEETGGRSFFPFKIQDLAVSFQDIGDELRAQYTIAYRPSNQRLDGTFRKIRIDVADKNLKAKYRTGYYAPRAAASLQ